MTIVTKVPDNRASLLRLEKYGASPRSVSGTSPGKPDFVEILLNNVTNHLSSALGSMAGETLPGKPDLVEILLNNVPKSLVKRSWEHGWGNLAWQARLSGNH